MPLTDREIRVSIGGAPWLERAACWRCRSAHLDHVYLASRRSARSHYSCFGRRRVLRRRNEGTALVAPTKTLLVLTQAGSEQRSHKYRRGPDSASGEISVRFSCPSLQRQGVTSQSFASSCEVRVKFGK